MKKADKPSIVININVYGDNNKVSTNETRSHVPAAVIVIVLIAVARSEERRVGKECRSRCSP